MWCNPALQEESLSFLHAWNQSVLHHINYRFTHAHHARSLRCHGLIYYRAKILKRAKILWIMAASMQLKTGITCIHTQLYVMTVTTRLTQSVEKLNSDQTWLMDKHDAFIGNLYSCRFAYGRRVNYCPSFALHVPRSGVFRNSVCIPVKLSTWLLTFYLYHRSAPCWQNMWWELLLIPTSCHKMLLHWQGLHTTLCVCTADKRYPWFPWLYKSSRRGYMYYLALHWKLAMPDLYDLTDGFMMALLSTSTPTFPS